MDSLDHESKFTQLQTIVEGLMEEQLTAFLSLHTYDLTVEQLKVAEKLIKGSELSQEEEYTVRYAVLFMNTGFLKDFEQPFKESANYAKAYLRDVHYPEEFVQGVSNAILALEQPDSLRNKVQAVVVDVYYSFLGKKKCTSFLKKWWLEENMNKKEQVGRYEWLRKKYKELNHQRFSTHTAQLQFDARRKANLIKIKKKTVDLNNESSLTNNKSAQTMFKTTLRNQVDLISIADKRAGIMISINSILITLLLPLMASYLIDLSRFMIPAVIMVLTCGVTIITATLATRPGKQKGRLNEDQIKEGKRSLFYFGNFFKMERQAYEKAIRNTISRKRVLESSLINDLYDLGVTLGEKYRRLRICYLVFAIGIGLTLLTTFISIMIPMGF